jgi:hypothetical protein
VAARENINDCKVFIERNSLDMAYVSYLRASEITVNLIPHHPNYRLTVDQRPNRYDQFSDLMLVSTLHTLSLGGPGLLYKPPVFAWSPCMLEFTHIWPSY